MGIGGKNAGSALQKMRPLVWAFIIFSTGFGWPAVHPAQAQDQAIAQTGIEEKPPVPTPAAVGQGPVNGVPLPVSQAVPPENDGHSAVQQEPAGASKKPAALPSALPRDLSPWGMFQSADIVVKSVMTGLAFASVVTWTIALAKMIELWGAKWQLRRGLNALSNAESLHKAETQVARKNKVVFRLMSAAAAEAERSKGLSPEGINERAAALLQRIEARAARGMTRGTGILASIGSTAPFVGLFGTVWGIMNSFIGISQTNTTNLAVVAPGIAEALLATASGLVAAIPAVIIYNALARSIAGYKASLSDVTAEVLRHLSRDLDRRDLADDEASWSQVKSRPDWPFATRQSAE